MKKIYFATGLALPLLNACTGLTDTDKPNIIYIMCDDLGWGDVGCYGQQLIETPHLDQMAREGMRFTQAYAGSPVSAPSRASFMTGQHTGHTEVRGNKEYWRGVPMVKYGDNDEFSRVGQHPYDADHIILPEIMKRNGYTTAMFGKWAGGYEGSHSTPDKRGIDEFYGYICQFQAHLYYPNFLNRFSRSKGDKGVVRDTLKQNILHPQSGEGYYNRTQYSADMIHREAMRWLDKQSAEQPFIGIFTYTLPHAELVQPNDSLLQHYTSKFVDDKDWIARGSRYNSSYRAHAQFAAMVSRLDIYVGEILDMLERKGLDRNTLVIFTSDNGPHQEGGADPTFFGENVPLRILTSYTELLIEANYMDADSQIYGDYFSDYASIFETTEIIDAETSAAVEYFGLENEVGIVTIKWLNKDNTTAQKFLKGRTAMYYLSTETVYVSSIWLYLHEFYHHFEHLLDSTAGNSWQSQAFCELGSSYSKYSVYLWEWGFTQNEQLSEIFYACTGRTYQTGRDNFYEAMDIITYVQNNYNLDYFSGGSQMNSITRYLFDLYGENTVFNLMLFPETVEEVTGKTWDELQTEWEEHIREKYSDVVLPDWAEEYLR